MRENKKNADTGHGGRVGENGKRASTTLSEYHETMKRARRLSPPDVLVVHPDYGSAVVPGGSRLIALENAAKHWGVRYEQVRGAEVLYIRPGEEEKHAIHSGRAGSDSAGR